MTTLTRLAAALTLAATLTGAAALAAPASAVPGEDYFVVDTQFYGGPSTIVDAGGAFAGCTSVKDLWGTGEAVSPERLLFTGEKRLSCSGGKVTVYYEATMDTASGKRTMGTWSVTDSTLAGATSGGGTVRGDNTVCTVAKNSGGCILDTFSGDVS